ncbi:MsnO8 family LLM class oxidoreductase [Streptomyces tricolor]|nr:MsnO8 family LLM class oxidoreductase [Streptomyces tricolor]
MSAEARGFQRYWVAEHHSMPGIVGSSPAVILAYLAAQTTRIRLGSGGVMLPNTPRWSSREQFHTLEAMAPGRVDLGLGRAPGTDQLTARALRRTHGPATGDTFPADVAELLGFLDDDFPTGIRTAGCTPYPARCRPSGGRPAVWLLGSSGVQRAAGRPAGTALRLRAPLPGPPHGPRAGAVPAVVPSLPRAGRAVHRRGRVRVRRGERRRRPGTRRSPGR